MRPSEKSWLRVAAVGLPILMVTLGTRRIIQSASAAPGVTDIAAVQADLDSLTAFAISGSTVPVPRLDDVNAARKLDYDPDPYELVDTEVPTSQAVEQAARAKPRWNVTAILISDSRRMAVVNEVLVSVGSSVPGGARIVAIEKDHVVLIEPGGARRVVGIQSDGGG